MSGLLDPQSAPHVLERLAATNPDCEIWFDSSPLVYPRWKQSVLDAAPADKRAAWAAQLTRLFDPDSVAATGEMAFGGVTTNPPLSLAAIEHDPEFWFAVVQDKLAEDEQAPDRLGELDLARRKVDPMDRRSVLVQRTLKGTAFLRDLRGIMTEASTAAKKPAAEAPAASRKAAAGG